MQHEVDRFVPGVVGTVAEKQLRPVEAGDGVTQPVAQGDQFDQRAAVVVVFVVVIVVFVGVAHRVGVSSRFSRQRA